MSIVFGIIIGMNDSQICFLPIILGIILCLASISPHHKDKAPTRLQGPRYRQGYRPSGYRTTQPTYRAGSSRVIYNHATFSSQPTYNHTYRLHSICNIHRVIGYPPISASLLSLLCYIYLMLIIYLSHQTIQPRGWGAFQPTIGTHSKSQPRGPAHDQAIHPSPPLPQLSCHHLLPAHPSLLPCTPSPSQLSNPILPPNPIPPAIYAKLLHI